MERTLISGEPQGLLAAVSSKQPAPCWHETAVPVCVVDGHEVSELVGPENPESKGCTLRLRPRQVTVTELVAKRAETRVRHPVQCFPYTTSKGGRA